MAQCKTCGGTGQNVHSGCRCSKCMGTGQHDYVAALGLPVLMVLSSGVFLYLSRWFYLLVTR